CFHPLPWLVLSTVHWPCRSGCTFAMVANRSSNGHSLASECIKSNDGDEEIIKVYLKARAEGSVNHEEHVNQLKTEVRYIQEARSSLKKLREDLSSKLENRQGDKQHTQVTGAFLGAPRYLPTAHPILLLPLQEEDDYSGEDVEKIRQTAKRLFTKLQEAEKQHQLERKAFEVPTHCSALLYLGLEVSPFLEARGAAWTHEFLGSNPPWPDPSKRPR
uniref:Uncharacterized protein n=1 Tax=Melopsittacus undulatus TaxID=13146 RepID=A0A8V5H218_MELUD